MFFLNTFYDAFSTKYIQTRGQEDKTGLKHLINIIYMHVTKIST